jgi:hypothetical protein
MPEPRTQEVSNRRGGAKNSFGHAAQMLVSTVLLIVSALLLIYGYNIPGVLALLVGLVLAFLRLS